MSYKDEFEKLKTKRDELKLKAHLFKSDVKDEWNELEDRWNHLEAKMKGAEKAAHESGQDVETAFSMLIDELKDGYTKVKHRLKAA